jgi:hypothetical protein
MSDVVRGNDTYLGDGLYASYDGVYVRLYAHNGVRTTAEVVLEPVALDALLVWAKKIGFCTA